MTASQAAASGKPPSDDGEDDDWAGWKPVWGGQGTAGGTPHDLQERRAPTETVLLRLPGGRQQAQQSRRRIVDARLWDSFSPVQQDAALEIAKSFETMGRGLGYSATDWLRVPGCRGQNNAAEIHARLITGYVEWTKRCHKQKVSHAMILDVLCFGHSLTQVDRDRRLARGRTRKNLMKGLDLYCVLKGWPV